MRECVIIDGVRSANSRAHNEKGWFRALRPDEVLTNVYDVTGQLVFNQTLSVSQGSQVITLDLDQLQNGMYFLTIDENEGSKSMVKFTVQH